MTGPHTTARRHFVLVEIALAAASGLLALVLAIVAMRVSPSDLSLRWTTGAADQVLHYTIFTSAYDTFPFLPNPQLGFPEAQNLFFAPLFDLWSALFVWAVSFVVPNGIWALNLYNLASFVAVGITSYMFFRALRARRSISLVFGVLFAVVPFHFLQLAYGHPFLSNYAALPLAGILALMVAGPRTNPFEGWVSRGRSRARRGWRRAVPIVVLSLLVAWTQSYYFVFGAILVGAVWLAALIGVLVRRGGIRSLLWPTVTTFSLFGLIGVQLAVLSLNFGDRYAKYFSARTFRDSEAFGGKLIDLILPATQSGFGFLGRVASAYQKSTALLPNSETSSTALIACLALVLAFGTLLIRLVGRHHEAPKGSLSRFLADERVGVLLTGLVVAFLFFTISGLGTVLAYFGTSEIRAWVRITILISMLALGVAAVFLETVVRRRWMLVTALVLISCVAVFDQIRSINTTLPILPTTDTALIDFVQKTETLLPDGCGVVELPLKGFPETGPIGKMGDYDEGLPYVYARADGLKFSYGAVSGTTSADYWAGLATPDQFASKVTESGACAILVDTYAYSDTPDGWKPWVAPLADPQNPAVVSTDPDQRYQLFTLEATAAP